MVSNFDKALVFFLNATLGIYILLLMLRFLLQLFRGGFRDVIARFIFQVTHPPLQVLYNIIPGWRGIDFAAIVLMILLEILKLFLTYLLLSDQSFGFFSLFVIALTRLVSLALRIFFWAIIIQVIFSWVALLSNNPSFYRENPLSGILYHLTEPLLGPVRRRLPYMQGIDISPLVVTILLYAGILLLGG
ncbi:MAG: YggT family protein [Pseudomonadota bacterium]|nr:YggT family protein [Pseudomonadota bacterium]